jgi:uncharacterized membrane-anchored protein YjiN (DUF445 family)
MYEPYTDDTWTPTCGVIAKWYAITSLLGVPLLIYKTLTPIMNNNWFLDNII